MLVRREGKNIRVENKGQAIVLETNEARELRDLLIELLKDIDKELIKNPEIPQIQPEPEVPKEREFKLFNDKTELYY